MATTIKSRMGEFLQAIGLTAEQFEKQVGLGGGFISRLNTKVRKSSIRKIASCYPNLNIAWLLTGESEMFSDNVLHTENLTTQKDRLHAYAEFLHLSDTAFCKKAELSPSFITKLSGNMRSRSAERIKKAFPLLNMEWVETGNGNMLLKHNSPIVDMSIVDRIKSIIGFLGIPRVVFEREVGLSRGYVNYADNVSQTTITKICDRYPFIDRNWLMWGIGDMITNSVHTIPLIDIMDENQVAYAFDDRWENITNTFSTANDKVDVAFKNIKIDGFPTECVALCRHCEYAQDGLFVVIHRGNAEVVHNSPSSKDGIVFQITDVIKRL